MHIHSRKDWELPDSAATPEKHFRNRRAFLKSLGMGIAGAAFAGRVSAATRGFPTTRNPNFNDTSLRLTPEDFVTSYNNFYEFGTDKAEPKIYANQGWETEPWSIEITGRTRIDVNDLIDRVGGIEQRVYRHRCVEAWSMVVPWDGFALRKLVELADPTEDARYVRFVTFNDPDSAIGQARGNLPYPYVEGLRLDEATNELAFIATGVYGKPMPNQNGAPLRLVVPWKYGFKGIKSIVQVDFVATQPRNTWQIMASNEYGFYANVNPNVAHPRWSQASERIIGEGSFFNPGRKPTLMFNGYESQVASLYEGLDLRRNY
jgi:sulfoxide reductase catalytic subunit YedY